MTIRQAGNIIAGAVTNLIPVGTILPYGGSTAPEGYLLCNGQAVSRTIYSDLFDVIGTTYGTGDGNTTFNLPDLDFLLKGVKGNGMTLGLTDGTINYGVSTYPNMSLVTDTSAYGASTGTSTNNALAGQKSLGITIDTTKSGIESEVNSNIHYVIKY